MIRKIEIERFSLTTSKPFNEVIARCASSYAPVTVLVDERADGAHLSYDKFRETNAHSK